MDFSTARFQFTRRGMSEFAAGSVVQRAYDTGQPQTLAGLTVAWVPGRGFRTYH